MNNHFKNHFHRGSLIDHFEKEFKMFPDNSTLLNLYVAWGGLVGGRPSHKSVYVVPHSGVSVGWVYVFPWGRISEDRKTCTVEGIWINPETFEAHKFSFGSKTRRYAYPEGAGYDMLYVQALINSDNGGLVVQACFTDYGSIVNSSSKYGHSTERNPMWLLTDMAEGPFLVENAVMDRISEAGFGLHALQDSPGEYAGAGNPASARHSNGFLRLAAKMKDSDNILLAVCQNPGGRSDLVKSVVPAEQWDSIKNKSYGNSEGWGLTFYTISSRGRLLNTWISGVAEGDKVFSGQSFGFGRWTDDADGPQLEVARIGSFAYKNKFNYKNFNTIGLIQSGKSYVTSYTPFASTYQHPTLGECFVFSNMRNLYQYMPIELGKGFDESLYRFPDNRSTSNGEYSSPPSVDWGGAFELSEYGGEHEKRWPYAPVIINPCRVPQPDGCVQLGNTDQIRKLRFGTFEHVKTLTRFLTNYLTTVKRDLSTGGGIEAPNVGEMPLFCGVGSDNVIRINHMLAIDHFSSFSTGMVMKHYSIPLNQEPGPIHTNFSSVEFLP